MNIKFTKEQHDGRIRQNRKEEKFYKEYTLITNKRGEGFNSPLMIRIYATDARHYACVWLHAYPISLSGGAFAGGRSKLLLIIGSL